jgi:Rps23 Pro-64 3,4-dihydroxylase Tpa1-like proline 4-hydroxylase
LDDYAPILANITYAFQDDKIVELVSEICGFEEIEPDPMLYAGGLSMMFQGNFLNPHLDNSHDGKRDRYRRLNLLYYVSPNWHQENGGNFELWDDSRTKVKTLVANTNRLIVMETNKLSWHSVSKVKVDKPRCCVSNYYFSKISPDSTDYFHVTSFTGRPEEKIKRMLGVIDNSLRNIASKTLKISRGKSRARIKKDGS